MKSSALGTSFFLWSDESPDKPLPAQKHSNLIAHYNIIIQNNFHALECAVGWITCSKEIQCCTHTRVMRVTSTNSDVAEATYSIILLELLSIHPEGQDEYSKHINQSYKLTGCVEQAPIDTINDII